MDPQRVEESRGAMRDTHFLRDAVGWGIALWLIGYLLGLALFVFVPTSMIGWVIMPVGAVIALWVLLTRVSANSMRCYAILSFVWTLIAVVFDYLFIVKVFNPSDGYYKLDVYLYYGLTFLLPLAVGWWKSEQRPLQTSPT